MSWITLDVDIDIDEFLSNCSKKDIQYIIECLIEDGHLDKKVLDKDKIKLNIVDDEWESSLNKLKTRRHQLSIGEENYIINLSNRLV